MARRRLLKHFLYVLYQNVRYDNSVNISPFEATGGTDQFTVVTTYPWSVTSKPEWITLNKVSGDKGATVITVTTTGNTGETQLSGNIEIETNNGAYHFTVGCTVKRAVSDEWVLDITPTDSAFLSLGDTKSYSAIYKHFVDHVEIPEDAQDVTTSPDITWMLNGNINSYATLNNGTILIIVNPDANTTGSISAIYNGAASRNQPQITVVSHNYIYDTAVELEPDLIDIGTFSSAKTSTIHSSALTVEAVEGEPVIVSWTALTPNDWTAVSGNPQGYVIIDENTGIISGITYKEDGPVDISVYWTPPVGKTIRTTAKLGIQKTEYLVDMDQVYVDIGETSMGSAYWVFVENDYPWYQYKTPIPNTAATWSVPSEYSQFIQVNPNNGEVTGLSAGSATLLCTYSGITGSGMCNVSPEPQPGIPDIHLFWNTGVTPVCGSSWNIMPPSTTGSCQLQIRFHSNTAYTGWRILECPDWVHFANPGGSASGPYEDDIFEMVSWDANPSTNQRRGHVEVALWDYSAYDFVDIWQGGTSS